MSILANEFVEMHTVDVVLLSDKLPFYSLDPRINVHQFGARGKGLARLRYYLGAFRFLRSLLRRHKQDVILSFGELIGPFVTASVTGLGAKVFVFNRGSPERSIRGISGILNPVVYPFTNGVVVQTEASMRALKSRYRFCKFLVIPNPVCLPDSVPEVFTRRKVIVNVGSIGRLKNQEALIRAFSAAVNRDEWQLHFVGDGPDRERLEDLIDRLGISAQVKFLGERSDVSSILADAQVFAFTSLSEGFPNALAEGLAHGCACISFDCPMGPAELIRHDISGILVPMGDERRYREQLKRLMNDDALRLRLGKQARRDMRRYSPDKVFVKFEQLIAASED